MRQAERASIKRVSNPLVGKFTIYWGWVDMEITNEIAELGFFFFFHTELSYNHKANITLLNVNKPYYFPVNSTESSRQPNQIIKKRD